MASMLFIFLPWVAHRASAVTGGDLVRKDGEAVVAGGRRLSGFLVVADSEPLRSDVASLHISNFEAIIRQSGIEDYQGFLHPVAPNLPFGFVIAPRLEKGAMSASQFIVPASVIESVDVPAWRFQVEWRNQRPGFGPYWMTVTRAEPWHADREKSRHLSEMGKN